MSNREHESIESLAALMAEDESAEPIGTLLVSQLVRDPDQPRRVFDQATLDELADSISAQGVIQPLVVSPLPGEVGTFMIVAGERRWRASQLAGLESVPVVIREYDPLARLAVQLIENIERDDLTLGEEVKAVERLLDGGVKAAEIARMLGKPRAWVSLRKKIAVNIEVFARVADKVRDAEAMGMLIDLVRLDSAACDRLLEADQLSRVAVRAALEAARTPVAPPADPPPSPPSPLRPVSSPAPDIDPDPAGPPAAPTAPAPTRVGDPPPEEAGAPGASGEPVPAPPAPPRRRDPVPRSQDEDVPPAPDLSGLKEQLAQALGLPVLLLAPGDATKGPGAFATLMLELPNEAALHELVKRLTS